MGQERELTEAMRHLINDVSKEQRQFAMEHMGQALVEFGREAAMTSKEVTDLVMAFHEAAMKQMRQMFLDE